MASAEDQAIAAINAAEPRKLTLASKEPVAKPICYAVDQQR